MMNVFTKRKHLVIYPSADYGLETGIYNTKINIISFVIKFHFFLETLKAYAGLQEIKRFASYISEV